MSYPHPLDDPRLRRARQADAAVPARQLDAAQAETGRLDDRLAADPTLALPRGRGRRDDFARERGGAGEQRVGLGIACRRSCNGRIRDTQPTRAAVKLDASRFSEDSPPCPSIVP
jgi:hypothetical protein